MNVRIVAIAAALSSFSCVSSAPPVHPSTGEPFSEAEVVKNSMILAATLYEGGGCTQDSRSITGNVSNLDDKEFDDEAMSAQLNGPKGTVFSVFDEKNFALTDDYSKVIKSDDQPVCVTSFEQNEVGKWVLYRGYSLWYSGGTNLDGKVSSVRWTKWWE